MALQKNNTKTFSGNKTGAARFVKDRLEALRPDSAWIMIITPGKSVEPYVISAIGASLADIENLVAKASLEAQPTTSPQHTPDGSSLPVRKRSVRKERNRDEL
jgi:hypothetical protein